MSVFWLNAYRYGSVLVPELVGISEGEQFRFSVMAINGAGLVSSAVLECVVDRMPSLL